MARPVQPLGTFGVVSVRRTKRGYVASTRFRELIGAYRRVTAGAATAAGAENKLKEKIAAGLPSQTEGDLGERLTAPWTCARNARRSSRCRAAGVDGV